MPEWRPDVTVVVGAYNAMPYLTRCLTSVAEQSIGWGRMEIVTVDDGSTDGTGAELDRFAHRHPRNVTVVHQENSGGPSAPRNLGLDLARGRYVFFLDADDFLGVEALERMVAAADDNGSDVVLGRMVGVGGRRTPQSMFRHNQARTDVFASRVYWTLNPLKLFRRALVERLGLRFRTDLRIGEDQPFTATAYLHAEAISVVADYDCVHWVGRDDGRNLTQSVWGAEEPLRFLQAMCELVGEHTEPGGRRDQLLHRHFTVDLRETLGQLALEPHRTDQEKAFRSLQALVTTWWGEGLAARLPALDRLLCHLIAQGLLDELLEVLRHGEASGTVVEGGRVFARYPFLRDPALGLPDGLYDITRELRVRHRLDGLTTAGGTVAVAGHAYVDGLGTEEPCTQLVLRERDGGGTFRLPVTHTGGSSGVRGGFEVTVDPARAADGDRLPDGLWDVFLDVGARGFTKPVRLGAERGPEVDDAPVLRIVPDGTGAAFPVTSYFTAPRGNLTLDVGERKHPLSSLVRVTGVAWSGDGGLAPGPALTVEGTSALAVPPPGEPAAGEFVLRAVDVARGTVCRVPVEVTGRRFTAQLPLTVLGRGDWALSLRPGSGRAAWPLPVPPGGGPGGAVRWRRYGLPWYAKSLGAGGERLVVRVARVGPLRAVRRRLAR